MGRECQVLLDSDSYHPGQMVTGRVVCNFLSTEKIKGIRMKYRGLATVDWKQNDNRRFKQEIYFEKMKCLLSSSPEEFVILEGNQWVSFSFSFELPPSLPSSVSLRHGSVEYYVEAIVDRPWAIDYKGTQKFTVRDNADLNTVKEAKKPIEMSRTKIPFSLFGETGPITISIKLPNTGYAVNELISFSVHVSNESKLVISGVRFQLIQKIEFSDGYHTTNYNTFSGKECTIKYDAIEPGNEKHGNLDLRVPCHLFTGNLSTCNLISDFFVLTGEVILPMPHRNLELRVPLIIGEVPLEKK